MLKGLAFGVAGVSVVFAIALTFYKPEVGQAYALISIAASLFKLAFGKFNP